LNPEDKNKKEKTKGPFIVANVKVENINLAGMRRMKDKNEAINGLTLFSLIIINQLSNIQWLAKCNQCIIS